MDKNRTATIKLDFPFEFDGEDVSELEMRRPKVRDTIASQKGKNDVDKTILLIANLVERPVELLHEVDESDMEKLQAQYMAFIGRQADTAHVS